MSTRIRDLAKELGVASNDIIARCIAEGVPQAEVSSAAPGIPAELEARIRQWFELAPPPDKLSFDLVPRQPDAHLPQQEKERIFAEAVELLRVAAGELGIAFTPPGVIDPAGKENPERIQEIAKEAEPDMALSRQERAARTPTKRSPRTSAKGKKDVPMLAVEVSRGRGTRIKRTTKPDGTVEETYDEIPQAKAILRADLVSLKELIESASTNIKSILDWGFAIGAKVVSTIGVVVRTARSGKSAEASKKE